MEKFKELSRDKVSVREEKISQFWDEIDLLHKSVETRKDGENYIFYEVKHL